MGGIASAIGGILAAPITGGINAAAGAVGGNQILNGKPGQEAVQADPEKEATARAMQALNDYSASQTSGATSDILGKYSSGQMSLQDAMKALGTGGQNALLTNGLTGSKAASDFVQNDNLTKGLFGAGGIQDQAQGMFGQLANNVQQDRGQYQDTLGNLDQDRQALLGRDQSYGLTNNDLAAYGQASGNIGRLYAQQGQSLAQQLADRGLASASNGATAAGYAGLMGNQNEQLAQQQQQISTNRINSAMQLAQARTNADLQRSGNALQAQSTDANVQSNNNSLINSLGNLGQEALSNQYNRQASGAQQQYNTLAGAAGLDQQNQALQQNINNTNFDQIQSTYQPGLIQGLTTAVSNAPGQIISGAAGGASSGVGSAAGSKLATALM